MAAQPGNGQADLIIRGGTVIDGTGAPGQAADVAVTGERITAVGDLSAMHAAAEVDAGGRTVAPGFIDVHTHDDRYLFTHPEMAPKASQGVTTVVVGNCGFSLAPWKRFAEDQFPFSLWQDRPELCFPTTAEFLDGLTARPFLTALRQHGRPGPAGHRRRDRGHAAGSGAVHRGRRHRHVQRPVLSAGAGRQRRRGGRRGRSHGPA